MLSSLNAYGGRFAADILKLFGATSASSSATSSTSASAAPPGISTSGVNDPGQAVKAILAQAQMATSERGSISITTVAAAYSAQTEDSGFFLNESITLAKPGAVQQIDDAVSLVNSGIIRNEYALDPAQNAGASSISVPIAVTAADAINITTNNGVVSATAMQGASFPNGLPSMASIQQALDLMKTTAEGIGWDGFEATPTTTAKNVADTWWNSVSGSFTLVKLPTNTTGSLGPNLVTFGANNQWAVVMPQTRVSLAVSAIQVQA